MFASKHHESTYAGLLEFAAAGLHAAAFQMFARYVPKNARVLDLGSGAGAFPKRLYDAQYSVMACDINPRTDRDFPYRKTDLNGDFSDQFEEGQFDAVSFVEVIEHLENPRNSFRHIRRLVKDGGFVLLTTPNASGLYSRLRFFFTGQMAMFTDDAYASPNGHITPLTAWQLEKVFMENGFTVVERTFHDAPFFPPKSAGDLAKIVAWTVFRPLMFGIVGGQSIMYILKKQPTTHQSSSKSLQESAVSH